MTKYSNISTCHKSTDTFESVWLKFLKLKCNIIEANAAAIGMLQGLTNMSQVTVHKETLGSRDAGIWSNKQCIGGTQLVEQHLRVETDGWRLGTSARFWAKSVTVLKKGIDLKHRLSILQRCCLTCCVTPAHCGVTCASAWARDAQVLWKLFTCKSQEVCW